MWWQAYQDRLAQLFARGSDLDIKARTELASLVGAKVSPAHCRYSPFCTTTLSSPPIFTSPDCTQ